MRLYLFIYKISSTQDNDIRSNLEEYSQFAFCNALYDSIEGSNSFVYNDHSGDSMKERNPLLDEYSEIMLIRVVSTTLSEKNQDSAVMDTDSYELEASSALTKSDCTYQNPIQSGEATDSQSLEYEATHENLINFLLQNESLRNIDELYKYLFSLEDYPTPFSNLVDDIDECTTHMSTPISND